MTPICPSNLGSRPLARERTFRWSARPRRRPPGNVERKRHEKKAKRVVRRSRGTASDRRRRSSVFHSSLLLKDKKLYINKSLEKERPAGAQSMRMRELDHVLRISVPYISRFPRFVLDLCFFLFVRFFVSSTPPHRRVNGTGRRGSSQLDPYFRLSVRREIVLNNFLGPYLF